MGSSLGRRVDGRGDVQEAGAWGLPFQRALWAVGGAGRALEAVQGRGGPRPAAGRLLGVYLRILLALAGPALGHRACSQGHLCLALAAPVDQLIRSALVSLPPALGTTIHLPTAAKMTFLRQTFQMPCPFTPLCLVPTTSPHSPSPHTAPPSPPEESAASYRP